jgi:hypothetical protein
MTNTTTLLSIRILEAINAELRRQAALAQPPAAPRWQPWRLVQSAAASASISLLLAIAPLLT